MQKVTLKLFRNLLGASGKCNNVFWLGFKDQSSANFNEISHESVCVEEVEPDEKVITYNEIRPNLLVYFGGDIQNTRELMTNPECSR